VTTDEAITYHAKELVAWTLGDVVARYRGGIQNDGTESYLETPSIIAVRGHGFDFRKHNKVALTNRTLFARDRHVCAYCGGHFANHATLSRDHILPKFLGGHDEWMNVVTSCKICNQKKGCKTLKEARMELIYVPYEPNHFENLILQNRNILADQMEYLLTGVPKHSRIIKMS
jgi:5-methylcytosine-specific restriction endonuclease McrA